MKKNLKPIYFDYAATTPLDYRVQRAMNICGTAVFGNPSSVHWPGQQASAAIFRSRQTIAKAIGAQYQNIVFTGSATEANNLALRGVVKKFLNQESGIRNYGKGNLQEKKSTTPRIIISAIEHESVLETARDLEQEGVEVVYLPVSQQGIIDVSALKKSLNENTILVSIMYANNEIGTVQPISKISDIIRNFRESRIKNLAFAKALAGKQELGKIKEESKPLIHNSKFIIQYPLFHTDAVQAFQYLDCNVDRLGIDLMTLSAHKLYGPKGIGALYVRYPQTMKTMITGGGQEGDLRSGTENLPAIVGFAEAIILAEKFRFRETKRVTGLRNHFWNGFKKIFPKAQLNGSLNQRLANNLNIYLPGSSAHDRCVELDLLGIAVSPGVACSARKTLPSYVIKALKLDSDRAARSLRFTFGRQTTKIEVDEALRQIKKSLII